MKQVTRKVRVLIYLSQTNMNKSLFEILELSYTRTTPELQTENLRIFVNRINTKQL